MLVMKKKTKLHLNDSVPTRINHIFYKARFITEAFRFLTEKKQNKKQNETEMAFPSICIVLTVY